MMLASVSSILTMLESRSRRERFIRRYGVPGGIRTPNLLIRSQKLYPVELQAHFAKSQAPNSKSQSRSGNFGAWSSRFGACEAGWPTGLEPATTRTTIWGSTIELRPPSRDVD